MTDQIDSNYLPHPLGDLYGLFADESINDLLKISDCARQSSNLSLQRFHVAVRNYIEQTLEPGIPPKSLDYFLGLSGKNGQSWAVTQIKLKTRDINLLSAMQILQNAHGCNDSKAYDLLLEAITEFFPRVLNLILDSNRKIENPLEHHLYAAWQTGQRIPKNRTSLIRIISSINEN